METADRLTARVRRALTAALPEGLGVHVTPCARSLAPAFDSTVCSGSATHRFTVGWASEGWPADVERLASLVPDVEVVAAARLSEGARAWLTGKGLGWVDEAGRVNIRRTSGLVIVREPADVRSRHEQSTSWTRSMLAVAEAALSGYKPTVEAIERATGLSRNATTSALNRLEMLGLLHRPGGNRGPKSGRRVVDSDAFLGSYATAAGESRAKQPTVLIHRLWSSPLAALRSEIAPALNAPKDPWAVTGPAASLLLAPYLSDVTTLDMYVGAELLAEPSRLASLLGGSVVARGHRIAVRQLPTAVSATGPVVDGIHVALPVRVYADLVATGGRGEEAAHHLKETIGVGTAS